MNRSPTVPATGVPTRHPEASALGRVRAVADSPWSQRLALLLVVALLAWIGSLSLATPAPKPVTAPATDFSADRAMVHLRLLAERARAIGDPGHDAAVTYLVEQLTAMGLTPEVQTATGIVRFEGADDFSAGTMRNVIVRIPGTASTGAIAIDAHYDSGETGPGASDNGSGVVTTLETLRALLAGPALRNDLIVVFADGEEEGDLGAQAFVDAHPWAKDVRLAFNFEAQGSGGIAILYATSPDDGWLTPEFLRVAPDPRAYSLIPQLDRALGGMRLSCDLAAYTEKGSAGLGFVYVGNTETYHTALDNVTRIDRGSIQQEGAYTLAAVRHFGALDLTNLPRASDAVFFTLLPGVVIHYGGGWVIPFALLVTALAGALVVAGRRRRLLTYRGVAAGLAAFVGGIIGVVLLVSLFWAGLQAVNPNDQTSLVGGYQSGRNALALTFAAIALVAALHALLRRWIRLANLTAGAVAGWTLLLWGVSLTLPGASYLVIWPLLFGLLPLAWLVFGPDRAARPWAWVAVLAVAAIPAVILLPATAYQALALINRADYMSRVTGGVPLLGIWAIFVAPLAALLLPHLDLLGGQATGLRRWIPAVAAALIALAFAGWAVAGSGFDAAHPRPDTIAYELNADTGQARWVSPDARLDDWTRQFFPASPARADYDLSPGLTVSAYSAPAPAATLLAPTATLLSDAVQGEQRTVHVRLASPRGAPRLEVTVAAPGEITAATLDGRPLDLSAYAPARDGRLRLTYAALPADGVELTLTVRAPGAITLTLRDRTTGLPALAGATITPRPADTMPATGFPRDPTLVRRTVAI